MSADDVTMAMIGGAAGLFILACLAVVIGKMNGDSDE